MKKEIATFGVILPALILAGISFGYAWMADDGYIYLRIAENIAAGEGPVWNVGQRVQAFTGVIWTFILAGIVFVFGHGEISVLFLSMGIIAGFGLTLSALAGKESKAGIVLGLGAAFVLVASKSFRDWTSGGLETPLLFLALGLLVATLSKMSEWSDSRRWFAAGSALSLLFLVRPDAVILGAAILVPTLLMRASPMKGCLWFVAGLTPFLAWEAFSLFYYGSLLPNTALSKMPPGYPRADLAMKGWYLLKETSIVDPVLPLVVFGAPVIVALAGGRREDVARLLLLPLLFVPATIWEGGDYMVGRLPAGLLVATVCVATKALGEIRWSIDFIKTHRNLSVSLFLFALSVPSGAVAGVFFLDAKGSIIFDSGVADERAYYKETNSLRAIMSGAEPRWKKGGRYVRGVIEKENVDAVLSAAAIGMLAREAGPRAFIIDKIGLADPFLSRLPTCLEWRAGHYERALPAGYTQSYLGAPLKMGPHLSSLLDDVRLATEAPLTYPGRASAIFRLMLKKPKPEDLMRELNVKDGVENGAGERKTGACHFQNEDSMASQVFFGKLRLRT